MLPILDTLKSNLEETGYISALPYLTVGTLQFFTGYLADWLKIRGILTLTQIRKYFTAFSFLIQAILLVGLAYTTDPLTCVIIVVFCITIGAFSSTGETFFVITFNLKSLTIFFPFIQTGFMVNPLDLAPQYASIILGISNTIATIPGILSPLLTGFIVTHSVS